VDGVALTVVEAAMDHFSVALIPYTLEQTTLGDRSVGDRVNLEIDVLGKYVLRYLERVLPGARKPS
jgi:riboflavin synthase